MKRFSFLALLSLAVASCGPHQKNDETMDYFGQSPPGDTPVIFAPGQVSRKGRFERVAAFSPDGKELFFTVTTAEWASTIMYARFEDGRWSEPDTAFFAKNYDNAEPFFSPDGQKLFFASTRPPGSPPWNHTLWVIERTEEGWSDPSLTGPAVIPGVGDYHPAITRDGTLYFASLRNAEKGKGDIFRSRLIDNAYQSAELLGEAINSPFQDWDPYVDPDERFILFKSNRPGGYGDMDNYVSFQREDGTWTDAENLGPPINTAYHDDAGDVSPDGKYLFFARRTDNEEMDIYWTGSDVIHVHENR